VFVRVTLWRNVVSVSVCRFIGVTGVLLQTPSAAAGLGRPGRRVPPRDWQGAVRSEPTGVLPLVVFGLKDSTQPVVGSILEQVELDCRVDTAQPFRVIGEYGPFPAASNVDDVSSARIEDAGGEEQLVDLGGGGGVEFAKDG
jgi:hypothetical protein